MAEVSKSRFNSLLVIIIAVVAVYLSKSSGNPYFSFFVSEPEDELQQQLLFGYKMVAANLESGSQIKALLGLRKATLRSPPESVQRLMKRIGESSTGLGKELDTLRNLEPSIEGKPPALKVYDTMTKIAQGATTKDILFPHNFDVNFVSSMYLATSVTSSSALATAKLETNPTRVEYLKRVAKEFDSIRKELIEALDGCQASN